MLLAALAVALLLATPQGLAGTFEDPEIDDTVDDASVATDLSGDFAAMVDVNRSWVTRDGSDLAFDINVVGSDVGFENAATTVDASWHVAFNANGSSWRIRLDWTGTPSEANVSLFRDGSFVNANVSESRSGDNLTMTWEAAVGTLGSTAVLTELFAFTQAEGSNDVDCHGQSVVDCAPNPAQNFGRDYALAGPVDDLSIAVSPSNQTIEKGGAGVFDATIANNGSEALNVTLSADAPESWNTSFVPPNVTIPAGSSASVALNVAVPDDAETGPTNLSVSANVGGDAVSATVTVDVTNATGSTGNPYSFSAPTASKTTTAGQAVGYDVVITNDGSESDKYSIHVDQGQKSWVSFSDKQVEIEAGQSKTISVQVKPPAATGVGSYEHLIGVHPLSNPPDTKTVTLTTTVESGGSGTDGDGDGFSLVDLLGTGQQRTIVLSALGAVVLLIVIIALVALKRRRDRRFYGEDEAEDEDHIYRP